MRLAQAPSEQEHMVQPLKCHTGIGATCVDVASDVMSASKGKRRQAPNTQLLDVKQQTTFPDGKSTRKRQRGGERPLKGVRQRKSGRWVAEIKDTVRQQRLWLGTFDCAEAAALAYDRAALTLRGPDTRTNYGIPTGFVFPNATPSASFSFAPNGGAVSAATNGHSNSVPLPYATAGRKAAEEDVMYGKEPTNGAVSTSTSPQLRQLHEVMSSAINDDFLGTTSSESRQCTFSAPSSAWTSIPWSPCPSSRSPSHSDGDDSGSTCAESPGSPPGDHRTSQMAGPDNTVSKGMNSSGIFVNSSVQTEHPDELVFDLEIPLGSGNDFLWSSPLFSPGQMPYDIASGSPRRYGGWHFGGTSSGVFLTERAEQFHMADEAVPSIEGLSAGGHLPQQPRMCPDFVVDLSSNLTPQTPSGDERGHDQTHCQSSASWQGNGEQDDAEFPWPNVDAFSSELPPMDLPVFSVLPGLVAEQHPLWDILDLPPLP